MKFTAEIKVTFPIYAQIWVYKIAFANAILMTGEFGASVSMARASRDGSDCWTAQLPLRSNRVWGYKFHTVRGLFWSDCLPDEPFFAGEENAWSI